jgi:hypothetical protein
MILPHKTHIQLEDLKISSFFMITSLPTGSCFFGSISRHSSTEEFDA